jgi:hypothetical protein
VSSNTHYKSGVVKNRYLIKHQGVWKIHTTWAISPDWDDEVTDVIWLKSDSMIASWWQMKNGRRYNMRPPECVKDEELSFLLLQVEDM